MAQEVTHETLTGGLTQLVNRARVLLQGAKREAGASLEDFIPHKITTLLDLIPAGTDFYRRIGVKRKSEAEAVWQKSYHHAAVREQVDELLQLEGEWNCFLESVDRGLQATTDARLSGATTSDSLSPDASFTDGRSGKSVTLGEFLGRGQKPLLVLIRHFG